MQDLRITLVQTNLHWEDAAANRQMLAEKIAALKETTDLILLPETFTTGFSMNAQKFAETMDGVTIQWLRETARESNCCITGSLMIREGEAFFNRLIWMRPDGTFETYDKRHLFSLSDEPKVYTAGKKRLMVELNGWKICPLICYDLRFPVWARNVTSDPYDLLIYVANWPEVRRYAWEHLLVARAIENLSFVAGVSRVGNDANDMYHSGDSMVLDPLGQVLYHKMDDEDVSTITLRKGELVKARKALPFLNDGDVFTINN